MECPVYQIKKKAGKVKLKKNFNITKLSSVQEKEIKNVINQDLNKKTIENEAAGGDTRLSRVEKYTGNKVRIHKKKGSSEHG